MKNSETEINQSINQSIKNFLTWPK